MSLHCPGILPQQTGQILVLFSRRYLLLDVYLHSCVLRLRVSLILPKKKRITPLICLPSSLHKKKLFFQKKKTPNKILSKTKKNRSLANIASNNYILQPLWYLRCLTCALMRLYARVFATTNEIRR